MKKALIFACILALLLTTGCKKSEDPKSTAQENVTLRIVGDNPTEKALEVVAKKFTAAYPNVRIEYEYMQNYIDLLPTRLKADTDKVDLFYTMNIQANTAYLESALELYGQGKQLDLSGVHEGLIRNFEFMGADDGVKRIYAIPYGAELRGMYVNKTLLNTLNIAVPQNRAELLAACQKLLDAGYVPLQGNPGEFGQQFLYPYICNLIANAEDPSAAYALVNNGEAGVSELFREPMQLGYDVTAKGYYNYQYAKEAFGIEYSSSEAVSLNFLNIFKNGDAYQKKDDVGQVAFLPSAMSMGRDMARYKEDYHSQIEYEFIMSPTGVDGGFAYMSPMDGIAINKNSDHLDWAVKFLNFLFQKENNELYASENGSIPNTKDAFNYISKLFSLPENHISHLGEVTFDYAFYATVKGVLTPLVKINNPKYMVDDGSGNLSLAPFEPFMETLETDLRAKADAVKQAAKE